MDKVEQDFKHFTVMAHEAVDALGCCDGKIYVDATLGGGGHSALILGKIRPHGRLIAFDVDIDAIQASKIRLGGLEGYENLTIIHDSYVNIKKNLQSLNIEKITGGIIFDLGASYHQLTKQERGFSFLKDAPLDMRFDQDAGKISNLKAKDVVNTYTESDLVKIFSEYGEERFSKRIAKKIVELRKLKTINTTVELADLIVNCTPRIKSRIHPATRVFQALRIEVNSELRNIKKSLQEIIPLLDIGAIISIISFHSLEDRLVKGVFKEWARDCRCEPCDARCNCQGAKLELINKKPVIATENEIKQNPPSRSAKLRVARVIR